MIKEAIDKIVKKGDLTYDEAYAVMNEIMNGETSATQNAAFWQRCRRKAPGRKPSMKFQAAPKPCAATRRR